MRIRTNQSGVSVVELLLVVVVIAVIAVVGIRLHNRSQVASTGATQSSVNQSPTATNVKPAPPVNSTSDLNAASATLDQTDPSTSNSVDTSQLDSQTSTF